MIHQIQPVHTADSGDQTHPAFAVAVVTNGSSTPGSVLFQSDLRHNRTVTLRIHEATRKRDLNRDWVHPGPQLIEIEMSLAQWATVMGSTGDGGGTPVTLRWHGETVPGMPYEPRMAESLSDTRAAVTDLLAEIKAASDDLNRLEDEKAPVKARREARRTLSMLIENAPSNAAYAARTLNEHAERTVERAKADIEVAIAQAAGRYGVDDMPALAVGPLAIEGD